MAKSKWSERCFPAVNFSCSELGTNNVEVKVDYDDSSTETCTSVVTLVDAIPPTAVCKDIIVYLDENGSASIVADDLDGGSSDNCTISLSADKTDFTLSDLGDNTIVLTATDAGMNSDQCNAAVRVEIGAAATWTGAVNSDWHTAGNWDSGMVPGAGTNVIIPAGLTNYPTIASTANCYDLLIESNASGTGSLVGQQNLYVNGVVNIQRYMDGGRWYIISSPAPGQSIASFLVENTNIPTKNTIDRGMTDFDEATDAWSPYFTNLEAGNLDRGKGYLLRTAANGTITFNGTLQSGVLNPPVTSTGFGWNAVGNPYPSAIAVNSSAGATNFIAQNIDPESPANSRLNPSYAAVYVWNQAMENYTIVTLGDAAYYAQSGQGFMVKANPGASNLQFTTAMQSHQPDIALKSVALPVPGITLFAQCNNQFRATRLLFGESMTMGLDIGYDAGVLKTGFDLYTRLPEDNGVDFGVQWLPQNSLNKVEIALGLDLKTDGHVTFTAETHHLPEGSLLVLEDRVRGAFTPLNEGAFYTVQLDQSSGVEGRFYLHTSNSLTSTARPDTPQAFKVYTGNGRIYIEGEVNGKANLALFDLLGRKIHMSQLERASINSFSTNGMKAGVYLLRIEHESGTFSQKIPISGY